MSGTSFVFLRSYITQTEGPLIGLKKSYDHIPSLAVVKKVENNYSYLKRHTDCCRNLRHESKALYIHVYRNWRRNLHALYLEIKYVVVCV